MTELYQFPLSHYCEKIRWALDFKQIPHTQITVLPGFHFLKTKSMGLSPTLPIIKHNGQLIQNSSTIITYLDQHDPEFPLTPADPKRREEALEWERYLDREIGPHIRRIYYFYLLQNKALTIDFFTHNGPPYGRFVLNRIYPVLRHFMRRMMQINETAVAASRKQIQAPIDKLRAHYETHPYLVGDQFTRADLTAAALLAPSHKPAQYGIPWPNQMPPEIEALTAELRPQTAWLPRIYQNHRVRLT